MLQRVHSLSKLRDQFLVRNVLFSDQIAAAAGLLRGRTATRPPLPGTAPALRGSAQQRLAPGAATLRQGLSELLELLSIKTQIRRTGSCCSFSKAELQGSLPTECRCCCRNRMHFLKGGGVSFEPSADTSTFPTPALCLHPGLC